MTSATCNNCGKVGHLQHQCKMPINSTGLVVFRRSNGGSTLQYLMICRKDSLGYVDFLRGKYSVYNKPYLLNMFYQMTKTEKEKLRTWTFDALWQDLWHGGVDVSGTSHLRTFSQHAEESSSASKGCDGNVWKKARTSITQMQSVSANANNNTSNNNMQRNASGVSQRRNEDMMVRERFHLLVSGVSTKTEKYNLATLLAESGDGHLQPEWGFPKGRKNFHEKELHCALREFQEETGYPATTLHVVDNICPFEEIFTGSNYKSYKHKYYLAEINESAAHLRPHPQQSEVSAMAWCTIDQCLRMIRAYNVEKKRLICTIDKLLRNYEFRYVQESETMV